ncbi:hypothetical protein EUGRSUZ_L01905 [Eucalyptus grandis]|uniref:DUF4220 domain-containing protein n=1 Tax=Eucalyptus grandis TaxID=71139 RepID=A0A058ZT94_EUCGR|nr:hypothetical protein EUGRSUZ_L01905 [Eucalyptus grandis]
MGFSLLLQNTRELWKEWELRLLVVLSLVLQLILAFQGSRKKSILGKWTQAVVWTTYLLADSIATLTLGVLSNRLANIKKTEGMIDRKSQITAFWAPFLLLHLGGPDTVTAYVVEDNELWPRHLARLCVQVGIACYIYLLALSGSTLWKLAAAMILVGIIKYAERTLCLYKASKRKLRDSMLSPLDVGPIYPRQTEHFTLKKEEGYRVRTNEVRHMPAPEYLPYSVQAGDKEIIKAYEFFKIFKRLFVGLTMNSVDLDFSRRMFTEGLNMHPWEIVEIELGFMYDLLFTKTPLLNCAWGIIRWVISLSVTCAVLVFFSIQDKMGYSVVDIYVTFLLMSVTILLEIYSLLLAISSDWLLQIIERSAISFDIALLRFSPSQRWSNSVAQFSLLSSSIRKRKSIFRHPWFAKLHEVVEKNFYISYEQFDRGNKELIFNCMRDMVSFVESEVYSGMLRMVRNVVGAAQLKSALLKLEMTNYLKRINYNELIWSVEMEFDQNILIWHIATELLHKDCGQKLATENNKDSRMSMFVSQYMFYLLVFHPSMLPAGTGVLPYEDTLVEAQKFFDEEIAMLSNVCWLLLQVRTELPAGKMCGAKSTSLLFHACHLADQLKSVDTWYIISRVWVRMLMYTACQCKGYEHCESLSRGGELLSHVGFSWRISA